MSLERVLIHLGAHKCGSTAIQQTAADNATSLLASGVFLAESTYDPPNHSFLADLAFDGKWVDLERYLVRQAGLAEQSGSRTLLLSGEDLSALIPAQVERVIDVLVSVCPAIQACLYLRNKTQYLVSQYLHWLTHGKSVSMAEFALNMRFSPRETVNSWSGRENVQLEVFRVEEIGDASIHFFRRYFDTETESKSVNVSLDGVTSTLTNLVAKPLLGDGIDHFTYALGQNLVPLDPDPIRSLLAREVGGLFPDEDWIINLADGGRLALIDDRPLAGLRASAESLTDLEKRVEAFFGILRQSLEAKYERTCREAMADGDS